MLSCIDKIDYVANNLTEQDLRDELWSVGTGLADLQRALMRYVWDMEEWQKQEMTVELGNTLLDRMQVLLDTCREADFVI